MFLVHDDQAERGERREHGGARADDDVDVAAADAMPLIVTFAVGESAVLNGDAFAERAAEDRGHRRRQRNLRHEHQHLTPLLPDGVGESQIDLRLAASGHAVQQRRLERAGGGERAQFVEDALLIGSKHHFQG